MPLNVGALAGGFVESALDQALGFGVGTALSRALEPEAVQLAQIAWSGNPARAVDAGIAASIVAEDVASQAWGEGEAIQHGIDAERFAAMVREVLNAPGVPELLACYRRGLIDPGQLVHGFRKARLETEWDAALTALEHELLAPAVLATAIQRGIIPDPGYLPVGPPTGVGKVAPMPVATIDPVAEAKGSGVTSERLAVLTRLVGLPASPEMAAAAYFRNIITRDDFDRAIAEGNTRNEWRDVILEASRQVLTPREYAELQLRGYISQQERDAGAGKHGMTAADAQLLYDVAGRSIPVRAITTGEARGGVYNGPHDGIPVAYLTALERGNLRPEYYSLAYANRYSYPSAFVLRSLVQTGAVTGDDAHRLLLEMGWRPDLAEKVAAAWSGGTTSTADKHVTRAETYLFTALHKSYVNGESDDTDAAAVMDLLTVPADAQARVLELFGEERGLARKTLTPSQIRKAYGESKLTHDEALQRLERTGYSPADAETILTA